MGLLGTLLGMLVGGYILGIWTASIVLRERQAAYEASARDQISKSSGRPGSKVAWRREPKP